MIQVSEENTLDRLKRNYADISNLYETKAYIKYFTANQLNIETFTDADYKKVLSYTLPKYIALELEGVALEGKRLMLKMFIDDEHWREQEAQVSPVTTLVDKVPKQQMFMKFKKRIQILFGSNKSGKSGTGANKLVRICLGLHEDFPHKPSPNKKLYFWACNASKKLIDESTALQIMKWLRPDQYDLKKDNQGHAETLTIYAENGGESKITFKPYESSVKNFESANLHGIWCDEPPPLGHFQAMWGRLVEHAGFMMITATTVERDSRYLREMVEGEGELGTFKKDLDIVDSLEIAVHENLFLSEQQIMEFAAGYAKNSAAYKKRVLGLYAEDTGLVFPNFIRENFDEVNRTRFNWSIYDPNELTEEMKTKAIRIDGSDYGRAAPFTYAVNFITLDGYYKGTPQFTFWKDDGFYQAGTEIYDQIEGMKNLFKIHGYPHKAVIDRQIINKYNGQKSIRNQYEEAIPQLKGLIRSLERDKRDPGTGLALLGGMVANVNPITNRPRFRINRKLRPFIREYEGLSWKESLSNNKEITVGNDHGIDPDRYIVMSGLIGEESFNLFKPKTTKEVQEKFDFIVQETKLKKNSNQLIDNYDSLEKDTKDRPYYGSI